MECKDIHSMKTKILTGLAFAATLLIAGPAYSKDKPHPAAHHGGGGGHHAVAAAHHASHARVASRAHPARANVASRSTSKAAARRDVAVNRAGVKRNTAVDRNLAAGNRNVTRSNNRNLTAGNTRSRNNAAFGGTANGGRNHYRYAFASHSGWNQNQAYFWHGHHYRWYGNGWFIIDPFGPGYGYWYNGGGSIGVDVQQALNQQGYYNGPVDGIVGPMTSQAISAYQSDHGLPVTGTITPNLLANLGVG
jgi:hypothetical protein